MTPTTGCLFVCNSRRKVNGTAGSQGPTSNLGLYVRTGQQLWHKFLLVVTSLLTALLPGILISPLLIVTT